MKVDPGRMTKTPTADASGMERRAHGEFVGPDGALASYALGWTTGGDERVGKLTVGIGVGNPGGATFHADVFDNGGALAYMLIDEPFEEVPQGGPHLTAEQARAHTDVKFIWYVADAVFERDPRARWMRHFVLGTRAIQTIECFELREPVTLVVNDDDDELWQLIGPSGATDIEQAKIGHLWHAVDEDPSLMDVLDLEPGEEAERAGKGLPWARPR